MAEEKYEKTEEESSSNKHAAVQPDKGTLNTTDPQEHMKGPLSSLMQGTKDTFQDNGSEEEVKEARE